MLPLVGRVIPIVGDDYADPEKGTGAVKITPAHDFNDFDVGRRHGLAVVNILDAEAGLLLADNGAFLAGASPDPAVMDLHGLDRFDREKIERATLSFETVVAHRKNLWQLPLAERKEIAGLPKNRADVILTGVLIFEMVVAEFGFQELRVSTRGLRFAAVMNQ